jgi:hypothetical protein
VLAFPLVVAGVRHQLSEVKKPWYVSADEHANAVSNYLRGEVVEGWEPREGVIARIAQLKMEVGSLESLVMVSHGDRVPHASPFALNRASQRYGYVEWIRSHPTGGQVSRTG